MDTNQALVSIVVRVCNSSKTLQASIESLISQTHQNIEIIAIDDASKDSSFQLLKTLKKQDQRLKIFKNKKRYGLAVCFNRAVKRAKGEFITFMDPNDISHKKRIVKQVKYLLTHPKVVAVGTQCTFLDSNNKRIGKSAYPIENDSITPTLLRGLSLQFETVMINRTLLPKDLLKFNPHSYPFIFSDVFMRFFPYGELANLTHNLYYHRENALEAYGKLAKSKQVRSFIKLFLKSVAEYDYRPSIQSLFPRVAR